MGANPMFIASPENFFGNGATANTAKDGSGTIVDLTGAAPSSGLRIDDLTLAATGNTTAGSVSFFIYNGATWKFWRAVSVPAITASATVPPFTINWSNLALVLKSGWKLGFAPYNAESFNVHVTRAGTF